MPYRYLAYTAEGEISQGTLEVESEEAAERALWARHLTIAELKPTRKPLDLMTVFPTFFGPRPRDVILFSRQLATLIDSGVDLTSALHILAEHIASKALASAIRQIEEEVRIGTSLSEAMGKHPFAFPPLYCRMIEVGQRTGNFAGVLQQLVAYMEKSRSMMIKLRGAMAYPAFVLSLAVVVVLIILNVTLPPMMGLFTEYGAELPWTTRLLLAVTTFFSTYKAHLFAGAALIAILTTWHISRPAGRRQRDWLLLRLPLLGKIVVQGSVARIARTMATLLKSGLPLPEVMELTQQTVINVIIREGLAEVRDEALQGRGISEPLSRVEFFPQMLSFMARIGEETGTLDEHLYTLAEFYEREVDRATKAMSAALEPAMTIIVGLIVGFVAVSVIMPMYGLLGAIR